MSHRLTSAEFKQLFGRRISPDNTTRNNKAVRTPKRTKAEEIALEELHREYLGQDVLICEQVRNLFRLPGGGVYIPDFAVLSPAGVRVIEVKGGYRGAGAEQGYERYKRAAAVFSGKAGVTFELWEINHGKSRRYTWEE